MNDFRIANAQTARGERVGVVAGDEVLDAVELTGNPADGSISEVLRDWDRVLERIDRALATGDDARRERLDVASLLAPVPAGASIFGAGANYYGHAREMAAHAGRPSPTDPRTTGQTSWHFLKAPSTLAGDGAAVALPAGSEDALDWEVELAAVIGRDAKDVAAESALDYVAGYTVGNDLSARALLWREGTPESSPFRADWIAHKNFDGACPLGPWLVPAVCIPDPQALGLGLRVNGEEMQSDSTSDMIFTLAEQIAHLSSRLTLRAGDVILTGTPGGVGSVRGRFLASGDIVEAWVEGIGTLTTNIVRKV